MAAAPNPAQTTVSYSDERIDLIGDGLGFPPPAALAAPGAAAHHPGDLALKPLAEHAQVRPGASVCDK